MVEPNNPHLRTLSHDTLYHIGLSTSDNLRGMFSDVKFICMGGSADRAKIFAEKAARELGFEAMLKGILEPIAKTERFVMYKVGPILSLNHGMGMPSMSILLHEIAKLMYYAGAKDVEMFRMGTSGGVGVEAGTVVVTTEAMNARLEPCMRKWILGKEVVRPTMLDVELGKEILEAAKASPKCKDIVVRRGRTMGTDDFYEGQGRLDGAICQYSEADKQAWIREISAKDVMNIEMEAPEFAAFCNFLHIRAAVLCCALLNRLHKDQVDASHEQLSSYSDNVQTVIIEYIKTKMMR